MAENISICFGTPLWSFKEENPSDLNNKLIQSIEEERKISDGVSISNQGGWQSKGNLHTKQGFQCLVDVINQRLIQVGKDYGFGNMSNKLKVTSMWANINPKGSSNAVHSHQSPSGMPNPLVLSGTYYVRVPHNSGQFVMEDFGRPMRYLQLPFQESNLINSFVLKLQPQEGSFFIFPAWMEHRVDENKSSEDRISIAFNIAIINRPNHKANS